MRDRTRGDETRPDPAVASPRNRRPQPFPQRRPPLIPLPSPQPHRRRSRPADDAVGDRAAPRTAVAQAPPPDADVDHRRSASSCWSGRSARSRTRSSRTSPAPSLRPEEDPAPAAPAVAEPIEFPQDEPAATAGTQPCATSGVLSSFENAEMVEGLAAAYNSQPRNVAGLVRDGDDHERQVRQWPPRRWPPGSPSLPGDQKPTVWLPDSSTWVDVAQSQGATNLRAEGTSVAHLGRRDRHAREPGRDHRMGCRGADVEPPSSRPPATPTCGAVSAIPNGERSSSARPAR